MNKKWMIIVIISLVCIGLITGIFMFTKSIKEDQKKALEIMQKIEKEYDKFSGTVTLFNEKREELAELLKDDNLYYATLSNNALKIEAKLTECDDTVAKIKKESNFLNENCNKYYADKEINSMCTNFNDSYSQIDEVFKNDVNSYNNTLRKYNEWTLKNKDFKKIEEYKIKNS